MATLAEELDELQRNDVRVACSRAQREISAAQETLRKVRPSNLLLKLVTVTPDGMNFAGNFRSVIEEHTVMPRTVSWYYALGLYVDLLKEEVERPKYP